MRPRAPLRARARRWGVSLLLLVTVAAFFYAGYGYAVVTRVRGLGSLSFGLGGGCFLVDWLGAPRPPAPTDKAHWLLDWSFRPSLRRGPEIFWWPSFKSGDTGRTGASRDYSTLMLPLWIPTLALGLGAAWSWTTFFRRRRVASLRAGLCPRCGYSRAGIAAGAACPECNDKATPRELAALCPESASPASPGVLSPTPATEPPAR
jgi:hypothetical protein